MIGLETHELSSSKLVIPISHPLPKLARNSLSVGLPSAARIPFNGSSDGQNTLIFSDGTGQVGGYEFDEDRTNVYKLFRASPSLADSCLDPHEQAAFYDPGLGSRGEGGFPLGRLVRWIYRKVSQATGLDITRNIIDCYAAIIRLAKPDDRIFLFGFSRGAYTVRCVAAVVALCGIPTRNLDGSKLPLDKAGSRKVEIPCAPKVLLA